MTTDEKNAAIAEMLIPNWKDLLATDYKGTLPMENLWDAACLCSKDYGSLRYNEDANRQFKVLEWIENLDMSDKHYKWTWDGEEHCNFEGFVSEIEGKTCWIWMNLSLDPSKEIAKGEGKNKKEAVFEALYQFSQYLKARQ